MSVSQAALRMICAMWLVDSASTLDPAQRIWMRTRLTMQAPWTGAELARMRAPLLAWAAALDTRFAAVVARCLDALDPQPFPLARDHG